MKKLFNVRYIFQYLNDPEVPFRKKIWIYLVIIYFLSPIDLIPEPLLGIGFIDDITIFLFSMFKLSEILEKYRTEKVSTQKPKDNVTIDNVEYKVHDD